MARKNIFVKVSGDLVANTQFVHWIGMLSQEAYVCICVGGGTRITAALKKAGYIEDDAEPQFCKLGRELATLAERQVARDVLEAQQAELQDTLAESYVHVTVEIPVMTIGGVLCHVNGDTLVETAYLGYDTLYVVTTPPREMAKRERFSHLPKVEIIAFS